MYFSLFNSGSKTQITQQITDYQQFIRKSFSIYFSQFGKNSF